MSGSLAFFSRKLSSPVRSAATWVVGGLSGLLLGGWAFGGDLLLNWDQVIGRHIPLPPGTWGLGPELPRRVPFYLPFAVLSQVVPGPLLIGLFLVGSVAVAVVGATRLAGGDAIGLVAGLVYGLSSFVLTRSAVGHLPLVAATALLPWAMPAFERGRRREVLWWALVFGLTGSSGALVGLVPAGLSILRGSGGVVATVRSVAMLAASQAPWVVPGLVVVFGGVDLPTVASAAFAIDLAGFGGLSRAVIGGGFFISDEDVAGRAGWVSVVLGLVTLGLGISGLMARRRLDLLALSATVGALLVFLPVLPLMSRYWGDLTSLGPLGVLRESQKFWPLFGLALVVGLATMVRSTNAMRLPIVFVLIGLTLGTAWPGLTGADGRLVAADESAALREVAEYLEADPATTVVFPWRRYDQLSISDGRTVLQPAPWLFAGPILISDDPEISGATSERREPRQIELSNLDIAVRGGAEIVPELQTLGVTRVLVEGSEAEFYRRIGSEDGVSTLVDDGGILLFSFATDLGLEWNGDPVPVLRTSAESWNRACERGWLAGAEPIERDGLACSLPGDDSLVWYPLALATIISLALALVAVVGLRLKDLLDW